MNQSKERIQNLILYILDTAALLAGYLLAGIIWKLAYKRAETISGLSDLLFNDLGAVLLAYVLVILFFNANRNFLKRNIYDEFRSACKINLMIAAVLSVIVFLKKDEDILPRGIYILVVVFNTLFMFAVHSLYKLHITRVRSGKNARRALIMTTRDRVENVIRESRKNAAWDLRIDGIILVDDEQENAEYGGIPVVASYSNMMDYFTRQVVDEVLICIPYDTGEALSGVVSQLEDMGIVVHINIERLNEFDEYKKNLGMYAGRPAITFANVFHDSNQLVIKRLMDIVGALAGLLITAVITVFLAPVLLIESRGSLIFSQERVGMNGRIFRIYKFRSMYPDAEERKKELMKQNEMSGLMFKMTDDPRITKVGKFIRKTSIDELPQFFNVLMGDMSLVGTRPPTLDEFRQYEGHHKRRLSMKPGITGLWQVSGRSDIEDFEDVVKLDLQYIDNWSLGLDIKIILKTVGVITFRKGAK